MRRFWFRDIMYIFRSQARRRTSYDKKSGFGKLFFLIIIIGMFYWSFMAFENSVKPTVMTLAEARAKAIAISAINEAVNNEIVSRVKYEDLVSLKKDDQGKVVALQTNTVTMNEIQALVSQVFQDKVSTIESNQLKIPIGNMFKSSILAGWGPQIKIKIIPVGTVKSQFLDDFITAGINQTKHKIWLEIDGKIAVVVPFMNTTSEIVTSIPIAETIIVGNVPTTYLDVRGSSAEEREKAWSIAPNMATMGK